MKRPFVAALCGSFASLVSAFASAQEGADPGAATAPPLTAPAPTVSPAAAPAAPKPAPALAVDARRDKPDATRQLEDGGLGLEWVYLNADVGAAYTDLISLKASNWALQDNAASGPAFGIGGGVRLVFLSLGACVRDLQLSSYNIWETDLEALFPEEQVSRPRAPRWRLS